ncbi:hypothetical protein SALBM135S_08562 [Streptomyces alboniger]
MWLGHQRLSIMDPRGGHQPLVGPDGRSCLVANGEIHNHRRRQGGTGPVTLQFTLAHVDETGSLLVARDALGVEPLYWARRDGCVLFASELRAFDRADRPLVKSFPPGCCWSPRGGLVHFADAVPPRVRPARRLQQPTAPGLPPRGGKLP